MSRLRLFVFLVVTGCTPVPSDNEQLALTDYWPEQRLLFIAHPRSGAVDVLRVPEAPRQGQLDFVERLTDRARTQVLRVAVDRARGRLWIADRDAIYIHQYWPRGSVTRIAYGLRHEAQLSDVVLDPDGNGYAFAASGARIYRISADTLESQLWLEAEGYPTQSKIVPARRVLIAKDGKQAIFESPRDGALYKVDLGQRKFTKLRRNGPVLLDCAVLLWNDAAEDSITAFHCYGRWTATIRIDHGQLSAKEQYNDPQR